MFDQSLTKLFSFQNNSSIIFPSETILPNFIKTKKISNSFSLIENEELKKLISITSSFLQNQNILKIPTLVEKKNEGVVLLGENNFWEVILIFSIWNIGSFPIPLNIRLINSEIEEQIKIINPKKIIFNSTSEYNYSKYNFPDIIEPIIFNINKLDDFTYNNTSIHNDYKKLSNLENIAVIIFTSGTTSKSKGVPLTFKNLISNATLGNQVFNYSNQDKWLLSLPLYHIGGFSILVRALLFNSNIIIPQSLKTEDLIFAIDETIPTLISLVPTQLRRIIKLDVNSPLSNKKNIKAVILSGGPSEINLIKEAIDNGWKIYKGYGSSETSAFVTSLPYEDLQKKLNSVGKPLSFPELDLNVDIKIVDENGKLLSPNSIGEIIISSPTLTNGYLNNQEETEKKFINHYYHTGDFGYLDEEGYLYIETRRTDLIVSGGENINPYEVEEKLLQHPSIKECCVFGIQDDEWGEIVSAVLITNDGIEINNFEIKKFLSDKLASHKIPKKIFYTTEIPKTSLGKIKREEIKSSFNS